MIVTNIKLEKSVSNIGDNSPTKGEYDHPYGRTEGHLVVILPHFVGRCDYLRGHIYDCSDTMKVNEFKTRIKYIV